MNRISLYITPNHSSVTVDQNGASRETSANQLVKMLDAMPTEDRAVLVKLASGIVEYTRTKQAGALGGI